ncbi:MAG: 30S ribosomal protein S7 [Candidatus Uhrbacteria bacterium]|nr:30S ribosomal protein S7 [Candidatus Uhrbacteria bacterium]
MRGKQAQKRIIEPDVKYGNVLLAKLTNYLMYDGKKSTAERVVYDAFDIISAETKQDPVDVFETAIKNVTPSMEVKSRRVGGANYQIPIPVRGERRYSLALKWMITIARSKKGKPMAQKLAVEIIAAFNNEGDAIKKKLDVQRMAEANRAFAHFAKR